MRDLNHDFKLLCQRNRDGSMATQNDWSWTCGCSSVGTTPGHLPNPWRSSTRSVGRSRGLDHPEDA